MAEINGTTFHLRIDLKGALMNWQPSEWRNCVTADDGHTMSPDEVKYAFLDLLSQGKRYIPFGKECDAWDGERCTGHKGESVRALEESA